MKFKSKNMLGLFLSYLRSVLLYFVLLIAVELCIVLLGITDMQFVFLSILVYIYCLYRFGIWKFRFIRFKELSDLIQSQVIYLLFLTAYVLGFGISFAVLGTIEVYMTIYKIVKGK